MGDWSQLIPDLLIMIARRIKIVEDFMAFRGVCTSWRAAGIEANFVTSWPTVPLLLLSEKEDSNDRQFYSLCRGKIWRTLSLPEAKGKECFESRGWLLIWDWMSGELSLLHPFSRAQIELPHQTTFPEFRETYTCSPYFPSIEKAVLSANPSDTTKFVLVVIYGGGMLGFWTPGKNSWGRMRQSYLHEHHAISDADFYYGKLYAISYMGNIWVWDVSGPDPAVAQYLFRINIELINCRKLYVVGSSSSLLIVAQGIPSLRDDCWATEFRVVQRDFNRGGWEKITSFPERAIFVGRNGAFCVDTTSFPGVIKPNCVYFIDDGIETYNQTQRGGGKNSMGVYNFEDRKIECPVGVQSFSLTCPPIWVTPSLI